MDVGFPSLHKAIDDADHCDSSLEGADRNESEVMGYIDGYYKEALERLPPSLIPRVLEAGFCFGFLDPVSNIITNTVAYEDSSSPAEKEANREEQGRRGKKRKKSQVGTGKGKKTGKIGDLGKIAAQSLGGLVAFLTSYFRYLTTQEALRYLRLAKADLLIAVHLIEEDRCTAAFTIHLMTTKVALICAALSAMSSKDFSGCVPTAQHSKAINFAHSSLTLASRLVEVFSLLPMQGRLSISTLRCLSKLSMQGINGTASSLEPMRRAVSRFHDDSRFHDVLKFLSPPRRAKNVSVPIPIDHELALMEVLLDRIHGFYLEAVSSFPAPCLRSRLHRSLLKAGHCYGPFDPVSNIILNTIWYDIMFPLRHEFKVDMICDESLAITECRSLHGLVTFVEKVFPALSSYESTRYLLVHNAILDGVILRATRDGYHAAIPLQDAYKAAARVAHHPNPTELANFVTMLKPWQERKLKSLLKAKRVLSPCDIHTISATLSSIGPPSKSLVLVQELTLRANMIVSAKRKEFEALQSMVCNRVEAALKKHEHDKGVGYELLAICGSNAQIPEPGNFGYFAYCDGYPYSHINIWARKKGSWDAAPRLLFIQCSNDSEDKEDIPLIFPVTVWEDAGRCFHCECEGAKIVHPTSVGYLGQDSDFEDMTLGDHSVSNEGLIGFWGQKTVFLDTSQDYHIYFDPAWDVDFAARLNRDAKREEDYGEEFTPAEINKISEMLNMMVASSVA
ncbi:unnamed protein product [Urochloa humidicola]